MSLSGDLKTMHLSDLLQWLHLGSKNGVVTVERYGVINRLYIEEGCLISATSNKVSRKTKIQKDLLQRTQEIIYDLFLWSEGKFSFKEEKPKLGPRPQLQEALSLQELLLEGARLYDESKRSKKDFLNSTGQSI